MKCVVKFPWNFHLTLILLPCPVVCAKGSVGGWFGGAIAQCPEWHMGKLRNEVTGRSGRAWSGLVARLAASCGSFRPKTLKQGEHDGIDG